MVASANTFFFSVLHLLTLSGRFMVGIGVRQCLPNTFSMSPELDTPNLVLAVSTSELMSGIRC